MKYRQGQLLKINTIAGMFYANPKRVSSRLVIYGIGAPMPPDNGKLPEAQTLLNFDTDVFVPDYIGFGRTDGVFTPRNCVKTFLELFHAFKHSCIGNSGYRNEVIKLQYDDIHFIGRSFGGMYVSLLPKFNRNITNLCLIFPILDYIACGNIAGEETVEGFMKAMDVDGYKHLYRGIHRNVWKKHFTNQDELYPFANIQFLQNTKLFVAHGKNDTNINFSHSKRFFEQVITQFPKKKSDIVLKLYKDGTHSDKTAKQAVIDYMHWQHVKEVA